MSALVETLRLQIRAAKLPKPVLELRFAPPRRFRFDLCWPDHMLACEVDGGVWQGGRHTRGQGFINDCTKMNLAVLGGWRVLRVTSAHIEDGSALATIEQALRIESVEKEKV